MTWNAYFGSSSSGSVYADAMKKTMEAALSSASSVTEWRQIAVAR